MGSHAQVVCLMSGAWAPRLCFVHEPYFSQPPEEPKLPILFSKIKLLSLGAGVLTTQGQ